MCNKVEVEVEQVNFFFFGSNSRDLPGLENVHYRFLIVA